MAPSGLLGSFTKFQKVLLFGVSCWDNIYIYIPQTSFSLWGSGGLKGSETYAGLGRGKSHAKSSPPSSHSNIQNKSCCACRTGVPRFENVFKTNVLALFFLVFFRNEATSNVILMVLLIGQLFLLFPKNENR